MHVQFVSSLPHILVGSMATVARAPYCEGFDQWVYVTYAALPENLRKDVQMIMGPLGTPIVFQQLMHSAPECSDLSGFIEWLAAIPEDAISESADLVLRSLARDVSAKTGKTISRPQVEDIEAFRSFLSETQCEWSEIAYTDDGYFRQLAHLLQHPGELKDRMALAIRRFWESHFRDLYRECEKQAARSARSYRRLSFDRGFSDAFATVAGRPAPRDVEKALPHLETLIFVPNCFTGPFVQFVQLDGSGEALALLYNCRGGGDGRKMAARELFPPLKALADETRLEILAVLSDQELYAQEIVEQVEISQPAVSRHLRLMVTGGILNLRKASGMKFYSVNVDALAALGTRLIEFIASDEGESQPS